MPGVQGRLLAQSGGTPIGASADNTAIAAPGASKYIAIYAVFMSQGGSGACWAALENTASGTPRYHTYLAQGDNVRIEFGNPYILPANELLNIQLSSTTNISLEYTIEYKILP